MATTPVETTEQALYRLAQSGLRTGNFNQSITRLERLEARFPFGRYAEQAQLDLIYARHMARDYDAATTAADRFIRLHPQHLERRLRVLPERASPSLARDRAAFSRFKGNSVARRDVSNVKRAFLDFHELTARFPNSEYAKDARQRMIHLRNLLADVRGERGVVLPATRGIRRRRQPSAPCGGALLAHAVRGGRLGGAHRDQLEARPRRTSPKTR